MFYFSLADLHFHTGLSHCLCNTVALRRCGNKTGNYEKKGGFFFPFLFLNHFPDLLGGVEKASKTIRINRLFTVMFSALGKKKKKKIKNKEKKIPIPAVFQKETDQV